MFRNDRADDRKSGKVVIIKKDAISAVPHHLLDSPHNDVLACDIGPPISPLNLMYIYRPPGGNSQTVVPLIELLKTLSDGSHFDRLPSHLNCSQYFESRNRVERIKNSGKVEYKTIIAGDAKTNKNML